MMGFMTGMDRRRCDICKQSFIAGATGRSHPYDDYSCEQCGWSGTICQTCGTNKCTECAGQIKSTHGKGPKGLMY